MLPLSPHPPPAKGWGRITLHHDISALCSVPGRHSKGLSPRTVKVQKGASGCHEPGFCLQAGTLIPMFTWSPLEEERENSSEAVFWIPVVPPPVWSQTQEPWCSHEPSCSELLDVPSSTSQVGKRKLQAARPHSLHGLPLRQSVREHLTGLANILCCEITMVQTSQVSVQFSSAIQSYPTLCDPMDRSTTGLPVHPQLLQFTQTHVR